MIPDAALDRLASRKDDWVRLRASDRARYCRSALVRVEAIADDWAAAGAAAQGLPPDSLVADEIRLTGPAVTARALRLYALALERGGRLDLPVVSLPGGRRGVRVMPFGLWDRILFPGVTCDVWVEPGREPGVGGLYREKEAGRARPGRVGLVLGAGNITSIAPTDALHKLFVEDEVVLLKLHPISDWLEPFLAHVLSDFVADGYVAIVRDEPGLAARLVRDDRVDTLHMTGAKPTYDAIVWGTDPTESGRRRASGRPLVTKPFTAELGCVTPVLVAPEDWSASAVAYQARSVAGMLALNAGFNCNAAKVVVIPQGWRRKGEFLDGLRRAFAGLPERPAYYPGARDRWRAFLDRYPRAETWGPDREGVVPWTLVPGVPARPGEYALTHEAFCGVLAVTELPGGDASEFLPRAAAFANDAIEGTLSAMVLADGATQRRHRAAFEEALSTLRYGTIGVNCWNGFAFGVMAPPWGAYPGNLPSDIGSGTGFAHNALMVDHPEKGVVRAPFRPPLKPLWFPDVKTARSIGRNLIRFTRRPSLATLPPLVWAAARA